MIILLHELAHKMGTLILPDGPLAENVPGNQSDLNTQKVMTKCEGAVRASQ